jgi:hypothetical protein
MYGHSGWYRGIIICTYSFLAEWGSKHSLPPLVELGHDDVLDLVSTGLGREVEDVGLVHFLVQLVQEEILQKKE